AADPRVGRPRRQDAGATNVAADVSSAVPSEPQAPARGLSADVIRPIFRQLLSALAAAHDAGLIHRDVKSSNVLLDRCPIRAPSVSAGFLSEPRAPASGVPSVADPSLALRARINAGQPPIPNPQSSTLNPQSSFIKLTDFGLARLQSGQTTLTKPDAVLGTPEYMSPEQARGESDIDHRTDLYSAGVVLYEMLTGRTPFRSDTPTATIHRILHEEPPHPRHFDKQVDPILASLALRLMAKRPDDRFASVGEALDALRTARRIHRPERLSRLKTRTLVATMVFAVIGALIWSLTQLTRGGRAAEVGPAGKPSIVNVTVDMDANRRLVLAQREHKGEWHELHEFPAHVQTARAVRVALPSGDTLVVAGINKVVDGCSLFGFDPTGAIVWRQDLTPKPNMKWPDCEQVGKWVCEWVCASNLDGIDGDEIVVAGHDMHEYPSRVSIIDPRDGRIKATFWHLGHIRYVQVWPEFFPDGRPAIMACGTNNKLDGFHRAPRSGERQLADWDSVQVTLLLDPGRLPGVGPPLVKGLEHLQSSNPYAYAFLNLASSSTTNPVRWRADGFQTLPRPEWSPAEIGKIDQVHRQPTSVNDGSSPWFLIDICAETPDGPVTDRVRLIVDRSLTLRGLGPRSDSAKSSLVEDKDLAYWTEHWRPIIQNGAYVNE
ncbi:MAG: serine/threonine-protein kinase, partial [Planctomycetota bacterium]